MSVLNIRSLNLDKLNSITKYPSILTYHALGDRGILQEQLNHDFSAYDEVDVSEKVDGTNSRIVLYINPSDPRGFWYLIGSREELLHFRGDVIHNPSMGIVDAIVNLAEQLGRELLEHYENKDFVVKDVVNTFYLETYGGKIGSNAKNYSTDGTVGFRIFDIATISVDELRGMMEWAPKDIALWREEKKGQRFLDVADLDGIAHSLHIPQVPRVAVKTHLLPTSINEGRIFLGVYCAESEVKLNGTGGGFPEGVVVRSQDRKVIAKMRYEDYDRTLKAMKKAKA